MPGVLFGFGSAVRCLSQTEAFLVPFPVVSYRIVVSARNRFYDHHAIDWILRWRSRRFRICALAALCFRDARGVAVAVSIASRADGIAVTRRATRATNASGIWIDQSANFIALILGVAGSATSALDVACCVGTSNGLAVIRDNRRRKRRRRRWWCDRRRRRRRRRRWFKVPSRANAVSQPGGTQPNSSQVPESSH